MVTRKSSAGPRNFPVRGGSLKYSTMSSRTNRQNSRGEIQTLPPRQTIFAERLLVLDTVRPPFSCALMGISSSKGKNRLKLFERIATFLEERPQYTQFLEDYKIII